MLTGLRVNGTPSVDSTTSAPSAARSTACPSCTSASTTLSCSCLIGKSAGRLVTATTSWPAASACSVSSRPVDPLAPKITILMVAPLADPLGARAAAEPVETHPQDFDPPTAPTYQVRTHEPTPSPGVLQRDHPSASSRLLGQRIDRLRCGRPQHNHAAESADDGDARHAQDRADHAGRPVPGPSPGRSGDAGAGGRGVAGGAQQHRSWGQLAVHHRGRPDQAQASLPHNSALTSY